jgi:hypothetical protein
MVEHTNFLVEPSQASDAQNHAQRAGLNNAANPMDDMEAT